MKATTLTQSNLMTDLEFTDDGGIILPDDPVGEHIVVTVSDEKPVLIKVTISCGGGKCEYWFGIDRT